MKNGFILPSTPMCKVIFVRDGVTYGAVMQTPKDIEDLRIAMQTRPQPVSAKQVVRIEPIQPRQELHRGHPAQHRMVQYASASDR